jgi:hypothetical protein
MFTPNLAELGWCRKVTVTNSTPLPLTVKAVQTLAHVDRTQSGEIDVEAVVDLKPGQSVKLKCLVELTASKEYSYSLADNILTFNLTGNDAKNTEIVKTIHVPLTKNSRNNRVLTALMYNGILYLERSIKE